MLVALAQVGCRRARVAFPVDTTRITSNTSPAGRTPPLPAVTTSPTGRAHTGYRFNPLEDSETIKTPEWPWIRGQ
ncbi:hypothetical protein GCM10023259_027970 [Thermocatellispora tengchongensis]